MGAGVAAGSARGFSHTDFPLALLKKYLRPSGAVCSVHPGASWPPGALGRCGVVLIGLATGENNSQQAIQWLMPWYAACLRGHWCAQAGLDTD